MDTRKQSGGTVCVSTNSIESYRYERSFFTYGWNHLSTNWDIQCSVMLLQLDTMGLIPIWFNI